jgi:hypothetical protein
MALLQLVKQHGTDLRFWLGILVALYTVYMGYQIQKRRKTDSQARLKVGELTIAVLLIVTFCFVVAVAT